MQLKIEEGREIVISLDRMKMLVVQDLIKDKFRIKSIIGFLLTSKY